MRALYQERFFLTTISVGLLLFWVVTTATPAYAVELNRPFEVESLEDERILVVDGGGSDWSNNGSEVFIFDKQGEVVWHYKDELVFAHAAEILADKTIVMADTFNNRLLAVNLETQEVVWNSEEWGKGTGKLSDGTRLSYPNDVDKTLGGLLLVTDRNNNRVLKLDKTGKVHLCLYPFFRPHNADPLTNGDLIISDSENHRVLRIDKNGEKVWELGKEDLDLNWPRDVDLLANGNVLITSTRNHRVIEATLGGEIVWEFNDLYWPYEADRLENGHTLIADSQQRRVIEVNSQKEIVREIKAYQFEEPSEFSNGGFETWQKWESDSPFKVERGLGKVDSNLLTDDLVPSGWTPGVMLAEGRACLGQEARIVRKGEKAGRVDSLGDNYAFWLQRAKVNPGQFYKFSGWIKTSLSWAELEADVNPDTSTAFADGRAEPTDTRAGAWFELWWEAESGGYLDQPGLTQIVKYQSDWQQRQWEGKVPDGTVAVQIRAMVRGKGSAWFDEVQWGRKRTIFGIGFDQIGWFLGGTGLVMAFYFALSKFRANRKQE